jgi:peptide/nickel transport system permease protein
MTVPPGDVELLTERHDAVDVAEESGSGGIQGRSPWSIAWRRLKRDKLALAGGIVVILLILLAIFARPIEHALGLDPNETHNGVNSLIDPSTQMPIGKLGGISADHWLGVEPGEGLGRDVLARIIEGAWVSLLVATAATLLSVVIGVVLGVIAGYYGGWIDAVVSRLMDIFLAFPLLLFAIAISAPLQTQKSVRIWPMPVHLSGTTLNIAVLVFIIGFFNWPYMGRIIRGQTLSLREREFVSAARSIGARGPYILFKELLPNLVAPIIVYSTLLIPTNILFEAALDFLAVGIQLPQASWGGMLSSSVKYYRNDPMYMLIPGIAIFITVLAFNLLGDGLRDALDPKAGRS